MTTFRAFVRWTLANWFLVVFLICACLALRGRIGESVLCVAETLWRVWK